MQSINEIIAGLLTKHTSPNGEISPIDCQADLATLARNDPDIMEPEEWAARKFENYKRTHGLHPAGTAAGQTVFGFAVDENAIIVLSEGANRTWVRFKDLKRDHIPLRQALIIKKAGEAMTAATREIEFWNTIKTKWDPARHPDIWGFVQELQGAVK